MLLKHWNLILIFLTFSIISVSYTHLDVYKRQPLYLRTRILMYHQKLNVMRKSVLLIMMLFAVSMAANAQKFALIDTEYIMKNIPAAQSANEQMQEATKKYQSEVEALAKEAQKMFQDYQAKSSTLSAAQKTKTEDAIVAKEKAAAELKRNYFGPEGELAKKMCIRDRSK